MPKEPMEKVSLRVPHALWVRAMERADEKGETVSEAVRKFLERYAMAQTTEVHPDLHERQMRALREAAQHLMVWGWYDLGQQVLDAGKEIHEKAKAEEATS